MHHPTVMQAFMPRHKGIGIECELGLGETSPLLLVMLICQRIDRHYKIESQPPNLPPRRTSWRLKLGVVPTEVIEWIE